MGEAGSERVHGRLQGVGDGRRVFCARSHCVHESAVYAHVEDGDEVNGEGRGEGGGAREEVGK